MKRTYCEYALWNLIPAIRNEIARSMIKNFGLTQKETAKKLGITPAAVSMYLSDKRGNIKIKDKKIMIEIKSSAQNIIKDENINLNKETCRICKIIKNKGLLPFSNSKTIDKKRDLLLFKF
ncbi:MAG: helix-turn-helix domain-containing protein [Thermoplasmatales archaeon]|nr:MAG: helix-turn-helix domain-containing protein [Thermoplasmatales archaeon]